MDPDLAPFVTNLLSSSTELRFQAESNFEHRRLTDPNSLCSLLSDILQSSQSVELRAMSTILLRPLLMREEWARLSVSTQSSLKRILLSCIQRENSEFVSKSLCHTTSELASWILLDNGWPEFLPFMFQHVSSDSPKLQERGFLIFAQLLQYTRDVLIPRVEPLHFVILQSLRVSQNSDVKIAALNAAINFLKYLSNSEDHFSNLLPAMIETLNIRNEATLQKSLKLFIELAETELRFPGEQLSSIISMALQIMEAEFSSEASRHLAIELVITLEEVQHGLPQWIQAHRGRLFAVLINMLLDINDDHRWHILEREEEGAGDTNNYSIAHQCLDRLSIFLGSDIMFFMALDQLLEHLVAPEWQNRHAALIALVQISGGCAEVMLNNLGWVVRIVLNSFEDPHPRVKCAAINAIQQLSTHLSFDLQYQYHQSILPALALALDDSHNPKIQAHAALALHDFISSKCLEDILIPHSNEISRKLLILTESDNQMMQESAMSGLKYLPILLENEYYADAMPRLHSIHTRLTGESSLSLG